MRSSVGARRVAALEPSHRFEHLLQQFADASASADRTAGIFFVFFTGVGVVRQILQRFFGLLPRNMLARLGRAAGLFLGGEHFAWAQRAEYFGRRRSEEHTSELQSLMRI